MTTKNKQPPQQGKPPDLAVVESMDDMDPESLMICAPGLRPTGPFSTSLDWISGKCTKCACDIHFSLAAPPSVPKVCVSCGLKGADLSRMAITEETLNDAMEIMGLPDTDEAREAIKARFLAGVAVELERRSNGDK